MFLRKITKEEIMKSTEEEVDHLIDSVNRLDEALDKYDMVRERANKVINTHLLFLLVLITVFYTGYITGSM